MGRSKSTDATAKSSNGSTITTTTILANSSTHTNASNASAAASRSYASISGNLIFDIFNFRQTIREDPVVTRARQIAAYYALTVRYKRDLVITVIEARGLIEKNKGKGSNPYAKMSLGYFKGQTRTLERTVNPVWNQEFR
jgi:hypothetical protein